MKVNLTAEMKKFITVAVQDEDCYAYSGSDPGENTLRSNEIYRDKL